MMYQRAAMECLSVEILRERASDLFEQPADHRAEHRIDPEEEHREDRHHDRHEDRRARGLRPIRPDHLAAFGADLAKELARAGLGHVAGPSRNRILTPSAIGPSPPRSGPGGAGWLRCRKSPGDLAIRPGDGK